MSADDWQECPVCREYIKEMIKYIYGKVPENIYEFAKKLYYNLGNSEKWEVSEEMYELLAYYKTDDEQIQKYMNYLSISFETLTPVEIRFCYDINKDKTFNIDFCAECHICGTEFEDELKK